MQVPRDRDRVFLVVDLDLRFCEERAIANCMDSGREPGCWPCQSTDAEATDEGLDLETVEVLPSGPAEDQMRQWLEETRPECGSRGAPRVNSGCAAAAADSSNTVVPSSEARASSWKCQGSDRDIPGRIARGQRLCRVLRWKSFGQRLARRQSGWGWLPTLWRWSNVLFDLFGYP